jgi:subtilisin family serine protease
MSINSSSNWLNSDQTKNAKPELSSPGTSINAGTDADGNPITMTGTSQATPHVAALAADLMAEKSVLQTRPYLLKAYLLRGSRDAITGGFDKVGWGGVDYNQAYYNGGYAYWQGNNDAFSGWDAGDVAPNNGSVDMNISVQSSWSKLRVVLSYLTRGTWTYDHRTDTYPIGRNLNLGVYKPDGTLAGASTSVYNGVEVVEFDPTVTGTYLVRIFALTNNDTAAKLHMGVVYGYE